MKYSCYSHFIAVDRWNVTHYKSACLRHQNGTKQNWLNFYTCDYYTQDICIVQSISVKPLHMTHLVRPSRGPLRRATFQHPCRWVNRMAPTTLAHLHSCQVSPSRWVWCRFQHCLDGPSWQPMRLAIEMGQLHGSCDAGLRAALSWRAILTVNETGHWDGPTTRVVWHRLKSSKSNLYWVTNTLYSDDGSIDSTAWWMLSWISWNCEFAQFVTEVNSPSTCLLHNKPLTVIPLLLLVVTAVCML